MKLLPNLMMRPSVGNIAPLTQEEEDRLYTLGSENDACSYAVSSGRKYSFEFFKLE